MTVKHLWLTDFRNHREINLSLDPGVTVVVGTNGRGKTNLIEALVWLARGMSFRGAPTEALVRSGAERAFVRAEVETAGRMVLLEAELVASGRNRIQVNRQRVTRLRDLLGHFRTTVFGPDDLRLIKGGPGDRRGWIDDLLVDLHSGNHALRGDLDRILRQRNTLLKQARGRSTPEVETTLDVWDSKLVEVAEGFDASAEVSLDGQSSGADSIMGLLMLAASKGKTIDVRAWGPDAEALADAVEALVADRFGEAM